MDNIDQRGVDCGYTEQIFNGASTKGLSMQAHRNQLLFSTAKNLMLLSSLFLFVLCVNFPIISFDMLYYEQPIIYLANQQIASLHDLLQVYLHPKMLEALTIPFFRPSGHFLLYQGITALLGWHNTKGFLVINFLFLALACFMMIKLYAALFPRYHVGGYIASGIYLMHPALMLSRLTPMHFEFACAFFMLSGLYCFVLFCQRNADRFLAGARTVLQQTHLLVLSLLLYVISVTFKEIALMLGPILFLYFYMMLYQGRSVSGYMSALKQKDALYILVLLIVVTLTLVVYITMMWPSLLHPRQSHHLIDMLHQAPALLTQLLKMLFGFWINNVDDASVYAKKLLWEAIIFPPAVQWLLWFLLGLLVVCVGIRLATCHHDQLQSYNRSFLFLGLSAIACLIMPVAWGQASSWHLGFSLVFVSLMMGYAFESMAHVFSHRQWVINASGILLALCAGLSTYAVSAMNTQFLKNDKSGFPLQVNYNAVFHPPAIQKELTASSLIVVEDSIIHNDYLLGASSYPVEYYQLSVDIHAGLGLKSFYDYPPVYGGTLFRWAYLMPSLREQVYPFHVENMKEIPDVTLYNWAQHYNNIFCLGYDAKANWQDKTAQFKANLLAEKTRRHLVIHRYTSQPVFAMRSDVKSALELPFVDIRYCQFVCDQNKRCEEFTLVRLKQGEMTPIRCYFYEAGRQTARLIHQQGMKFVKDTAVG